MHALLIVDLCLLAGILLIGVPAAYLLTPLASRRRSEGRAAIGGAVIGLACGAAGEIIGGFVGLAITR